MLSKARIGSHSLHPMLIAIPVTAYLATLASLIGLAATRDPFWFRVALWANMVGVGGALLAAVPGAIDLVAVVPRRSVARKAGVFHALTNVAALALFAINLSLITDAYNDREGYNLTAGLVLTGGGVLLTAIAGWFGWEMVQRHHIGVLDQPESAVDDRPVVASGVAGDTSSLPVTDSQVLAAEEAPTGRWPRDDSPTESGTISRH